MPLYIHFIMNPFATLHIPKFPWLQCPLFCIRLHFSNEPNDPSPFLEIPSRPLPNFRRATGALRRARVAPRGRRRRYGIPRPGHGHAGHDISAVRLRRLPRISSTTTTTNTTTRRRAPRIFTARIAIVVVVAILPSIASTSTIVVGGARRSVTPGRVGILRRRRRWRTVPCRRVGVVVWCDGSGRAAAVAVVAQLRGRFAGRVVRTRRLFLVNLF